MTLRGDHPSRIGAWTYGPYVVQLLRHASHPAAEHLCVQRQDGGDDIPWSDLQAIKDRFAPAGPDRWALEVFPPAEALVDDQNLRHLWVMPQDWTPPVDLRELSLATSSARQGRGPGGPKGPAATWPGAPAAGPSPAPSTRPGGPA